MTLQCFISADSSDSFDCKAKAEIDGVYNASIETLPSQCINAVHYIFEMLSCISLMLFLL